MTCLYGYCGNVLKIDVQEFINVTVYIFTVQTNPKIEK